MSDRFRRRVRDGLALSGALPDRSLVAMVAAMSLLAALTLAGAGGARALSERWAKGAAGLLTIQVPDPDKPAARTTGATTPRNQSSPQSDGSAPDPTRVQAVMAALQGKAELASVHQLGPQELNDLLRPWLGTGALASALALPTVIEVHLQPGVAPADADLSALEKIAPGTLIERNDDWRDRLRDIAQSLLACAALAIVLVSAVGAAVIGMATRLGLGARRESIAILHGLGAPDGYVARRFGRRIAGLCLVGGLVGSAASFLPIAFVSRLMLPLSGPQAGQTALPAGTGLMTLLRTPLPEGLLLTLACVPALVTFIGWLTAQVIVRTWLRRLP